MFGRQEPGKPGRIFYYQFFDPEKDRFANITVFEFNPENFSAFAPHLWPPARTGSHNCIAGSSNRMGASFHGEAVSRYSQFNVESFRRDRGRTLVLQEGSRQSQEMTFGELQRYIRDLSQSGFDTMRLSVQLNRKLAYPLVTLVMAVLAIPFALSMGQRGSLTGIAVAIGVAIAYWVVTGTFEALGNVNMLPAMLAAWSPDLLFGLAGELPAAANAYLSPHIYVGFLPRTHSSRSW